jgi:hypothetical protein
MSMSVMTRSSADAPDAARRGALRAGQTVLECLRVLAKTGDNVVGEVLRGSGSFVEWEHYPENDVYDPETHAQYYYHAHPPEARGLAEHGHFHLFLRPKGMPAGMRPPSGDNDALSHLVAISMDRFGLPRRLFTTNRWVTGETWYAAADVIAMLDRFVVDVARPNWIVSTWITAMVQLYRADIANLVRERDRAIGRWRAQYPSANVFEDRRLEIASIQEIDVAARVRELARAPLDRS